MVSNTGEKKGVAQVWDLAKSEALCDLVQDFKWTNCIRLSPDATRLVTSGNPPYGVLWDVATGQELRRFDLGETSFTSAAAFSPDGRLLALGAVGRVRLFEVESGDVLGDVHLPNNRSVPDLVFAPSGKTLACGQAGGHINRIDVDSRNVIETWQASDATVLSVRFLNYDRFLLTTSDDGALRIWDVAQGQVVAAAATGIGANGEMSVSPDGRHAVTSGGETWDPESSTWKDSGDYALRLWQLPKSVWPDKEEKSEPEQD
jgi:WD40 repeat protein